MKHVIRFVAVLIWLLLNCGCGATTFPEWPSGRELEREFPGTPEWYQDDLIHVAPVDAVTVEGGLYVFARIEGGPNLTYKRCSGIAESLCKLYRSDKAIQITDSRGESVYLRPLKRQAALFQSTHWVDLPCKEEETNGARKRFIQILAFRTEGDLPPGRYTLKLRSIWDEWRGVRVDESPIVFAVP